MSACIFNIVRKISKFRNWEHAKLLYIERTYLSTFPIVSNSRIENIVCFPFWAPFNGKFCSNNTRKSLKNSRHGPSFPWLQFIGILGGSRNKQYDR